MKHSFFVVSMFFFLVSVINSQEYFLKHVDIPNYQDVGGFGIIKVDDGYVVGGLTIPKDTSAFEMFMAFLNDDGDLVHYDITGFERNSTNLSLNSELIDRGDNILWYRWNSSTIKFLSYDWKGNVITIEDEYPVYSDHGFSTRDYVPLSDEKGYMLTGTFTDQGKADFGMVKISVDSISKYRINTPELNNRGKRIIMNNDETFTVLAENSLTDSSKNLKVYKFDEELQLLETIEGDTLYNSLSYNDAIIDKTGNYIYTHFIIQREPEELYLPQISFMSRDGRTQWTTSIGRHIDEAGSASWNCIKESPTHDGYIIAGGSRIENADSTYTYAALAKVSPEGDSIWYRKFSILGWRRTTHIFYDMEVADNGDIIAVGYSYYGSQPPPDKDRAELLVVRTDKDGLIQPDSSVSIVTIDKDIEISIYPNPTQDMIYIQHLAGKRLDYEILSSGGQLMQQFHGGRVEETFIYDGSSLPSGDYYLRYSDSSSLVQGAQKILIIR